MATKNMNYFLIEANKVKLGGYVKIKNSFLINIINLLYEPGTSAYNKLISRYSSGISSGYGHTSVQNLIPNIFKNYKYLASSGTNLVLSNIYDKARLNHAYRELAFVLFITGLVDSRDYLKHCPDIYSVMNRLSVESDVSQDTEEVFKPLVISNKEYCELMGMLLKNTSEGVDYGLSPYDFIYHMLKVFGADYNRYDYVCGFMEDLGISDFTKLKLSSAIIEKYPEEVTVVLPVLSKYMKPESSFRVLDKVLYKVSPSLMEVVLRNYNFIINSGMRGIEYNK